MDESAIKKSNCDQKTRRIFIDFLSSSSGKMNHAHLTQMFKSEFNLDIEFGGSIEVVDLKKFISEALNREDIVVSSLSSLYGQASINLQGSETVAVECASCGEPGDKNIKLKVDQKTIWLSSNLKIKKRGYILTKDVSPFATNLDSSFLEPAHALDDGKGHFFQDIDHLKFFRANKRLRKGQALKQKDLIPKTLVKLNQEVEVLLKGQNITLKTNAKARQSGSHGDRIKLYNNKTKKNILGTVIDFNTVMVEL